MSKSKFNKTVKSGLDPDKVQRQASDPKASVWLSANAGTGKTKVLTDRVLRLLLDRNAPEDILCVTFTTAAANVMQRRIRAELSKWTTCSDYLLDKDLKKLTGKKPDVAMRYHARRLFARFLEAPEGIKIQTIHALSQNLIKKFPIESGVPPSFKVMDSEDTLALVREVQGQVFQQAQDNVETDLAAAVGMITPEVGEDEFVTLIQNIVTNREKFYALLDAHGTLENTIHAVYDYLNADMDLTGADLKFMVGDQAASLSGKAADFQSLRQAVTVLSQGSATDQNKAHVLKTWLDASLEERKLMFQEYTRVFLTEKGAVRKRLATKKSESVLPVLQQEAARLIDVLEHIKTANVAQGTKALLILADVVLHTYEAAKADLNYLDYDDLILKATQLLEDDHHTSWVLKKLPGHLKHILVDEAQDTSPYQWKIVESLLKSFLNAPDVTDKNNRTVFVVGDEKQSIFSFQGADPQEFSRRRDLFKKLVEKNKGLWRDVSMDITFRSTPAILQAVDAIFQQDIAAKGIQFDEDKALEHKSFREGQSGLVEVNAVVTGNAPDPLEPWALPDTLETVDDTAIEVAEEIADRIQGWLDNKEQLEARGRPINPNDIMILVRRRSAFVNHVVRALKKRNVPVSGVDRMILSEQIAVKDLLALSEALLNPMDDYKLAVVLKTPAIGMTDQQLEDFALNRTGSLWDALADKAQNCTAQEDQTCKQVFAYLSDLKRQMREQGTYAFYSDILMKPCPANERSGLTAIYARLGVEAEDPMVEFLNALERFEKDHPPSMQSFLNWVMAGDAEVKREMNHNSQHPKVSIMTVHGAKGLEAPIVILADTTGVPADNIRARPRLLWPEGDRDVPLWVPHVNLENKVFKQERIKVERVRDDEYRRLLYVAMTRAADRLYVYGHQNRQSVHEESWHNLIAQGLLNGLPDKVEVSKPEDDENAKGERIIFKTEQQADPNDDGVLTFTRSKRKALPEWVRTEPQVEDDLKQVFRPSTALEDQNPANNDNETSLPSPLNQGADMAHIFKQGKIIHNVLEFLPNIALKDQKKIVQMYLTHHDLTERQQRYILKQVLAIVDHPDYEFLFAENSKSEVVISGDIHVNGTLQHINSQIDRLVVEDDTVWVVDYKSNASIPDQDTDISDQYVAQMAAYRHVVQKLYPDKQVKTALLWTRAPKLQVIPEQQLDQMATSLGLGQKEKPKTEAKKTPPSTHTPKAKSVGLKPSRIKKR